MPYCNSLQNWYNNSINTAVTICKYGEYPSILLFFTEKPPVPAVANAVVRASNTLIPPKSKSINCVKVITAYIEYSISAVVLTLGTSLLTEGPGLSAFIMNIF